MFKTKTPEQSFLEAVTAARKKKPIKDKVFVQIRNNAVKDSIYDAKNHNFFEKQIARGNKIRDDFKRVIDKRLKLQNMHWHDDLD